MANSRMIVLGVLVMLLAGLSAPTAAAPADQTAPAVVSGPSVSTSAAPLTVDEMAQYAQRQADAQQAGALDEKGGKIDNPWIIVGVVVFAMIFAGLGIAIANGGA